MASTANLLVVEDDTSSRLALGSLLEDEGYHVETAAHGAEALKCVSEGEIDLVISDVQMPGIDGFTVVRRLRQSSKSRDLPIILVSGQGSPDRRAAGLQLGADDFMAKPLNFDELLARVEIQLRRLVRNRALLQEVVRDPLTETLNRRGILEVLKTELKRAQRHNTSTSVLMIDLNDFKIINDTRGHAAGDEVLREVANALRCTIRAHDRVGRLGGDEFLIVLSDTEDRDARILVERLRTCTDAAGLAIGLATARGAELPDVLIRQADGAMYEDKAGQRRGVWKQG